MGKYFLYRGGVPRVLTDITEEEAIAAARKEAEKFPSATIELYGDSEYGSCAIDYKEKKCRK